MLLGIMPGGHDLYDLIATVCVVLFVNNRSTIALLYGYYISCLT